MTTAQIETTSTHTQKSSQNNQNTHDPRLKTLYLTGYGTTLTKKQEQFVVKQEGKVIKQIPAIHVDQIMLFGAIQLTTQVMHYCLKHNIPIYFLSSTGSYYGILDNHDTHPIHLHRQQYLKAENPQYALKIAQHMIKGKLSNSRLLLKRLARSQNKTQHRESLQIAAQNMSAYIKQLNTATDLDQLRGIEGIAARNYFQALINITPHEWNFNGRNKQPPTDPVNALLSYGYTLLFHNTYSFIKVAGLNPHIGFLHTPRRGHPALASDLMEEFRAVIVDAVIFNLILNNKLTPDDFQHPEKKGEACHISKAARNILIRHLETKFNTPITHPNSGFKIDYRRCIEHQTNHLASLIRGHIEETENQETENSSTYQPAIFR